MSEIALAKINSFGQSPEADHVPPSEEAVFIFTSSQLKDLIKEAIQPLQDEVMQLKATMAAQEEKIAALETTEEHDVNRICLDIAYDRQRISRLEKIEPQPLQKDRGEILRALIASAGGKMLAKDARQKMHLGKEQFSLLLSKMGEYIEAKPFHQDKRKLVLIIK
jgi:hypothetical protein